MMRFALVLAFLAASATAYADAPWPVDPDLGSKKARKDISGAACGGGRCFAVNDETHTIQEFEIGDRRITPGEKLRLLKKGEEIDAEAIAWADGAFFVTGSHGLSRKKARFDAATFTVFRIEGADIEISTRLRELIRAAPLLGD